jgi:hypothetical protein
MSQDALTAFKFEGCWIPQLPHSFVYIYILGGSRFKYGRVLRLTTPSRATLGEILGDQASISSFRRAIVQDACQFPPSSEPAGRCSPTGRCRAADRPWRDLGPNRIVERPKVIYNDKTRKYVLWMQIDNRDYKDARTGVASGGEVCGKYRMFTARFPGRPGT